MASGYSSLHPLTREALKELGVPSKHVTQGYGDAVASAGYHRQEGLIDGNPYSSCVDISFRPEYANTKWKSRAIAAGFCPFFRQPPQWSGSKHIHMVHVGLRDDLGRCRVLPGPRAQIVDFTRGLNGLVSHGRLVGELAPTVKERDRIEDKYNDWAPSVRTSVYGPDGAWIPCYAWYDSDTSRVTCEVRAFYETIGVSLLDWSGVGLYVRLPNGKTLNLQFKDPTDVQLCGDFLRGSIRTLCQMVFRTEPNISFESDGVTAKVQIKKFDWRVS